MRKCGQCGGKLRRVHRTFLERFNYLAIYECKHCEREVLIPRTHTYHFGNVCRCPKCGTFRIVKLKVQDKIDPMQGGVLNWLERIAGGNLYHCCFCRIQFFDRRPLDPNASRVAAHPEETRPNGAGNPEREVHPPPEVHPQVSRDEAHEPER